MLGGLPIRRPASAELARDAREMPYFPVEASGGISAAWEGSALVLRDYRPAPVWAIITGQASGTNRYAWTQLNDGDVDATFPASLSDGFAAEGTSAEDGFCAYELTGNANVPVGAKVQLWPAGDFSFWAFVYHGLGGDPDGPGSVSVTTDPVNGEPATQFIITTDPSDPNSPVLQYVVAENADGLGNPGVIQYIYPNGTGSDPSFTQLTTEFQTTVTYNVGGTEITQSVTEPSAGVVQIHTGNPAGTQGTTAQYTVDGDGDIDQLVVTTKTDGATNGVVHQFTTDNGDTLEAVTGDIDFSGATGTAWRKLGTITHSDLTDADGSQDVTVTTLAAKVAVMGLAVHVRVVGSGGGVGNLTLQFVVGGGLAGNTGNGLNANDSGCFYHPDSTTRQVLSFTATTAVAVRFTADVNVADLTGGEWDVYGFCPVLP